MYFKFFSLLLIFLIEIILTYLPLFNDGRIFAFWAFMWYLLKKSARSIPYLVPSMLLSWRSWFIWKFTGSDIEESGVSCFFSSSSSSASLSKIFRVFSSSLFSDSSYLNSQLKLYTRQAVYIVKNKEYMLFKFFLLLK